MAKKVRGFGEKIFFTVIFLVCFSIIAYYFKDRFNKPSFVLYKEFGIYIPVNYQIHGIDVSRHQQQIEWDAVKQMRVNNVAIGFAFIKATEGTDLIDVAYRNNMRNALAADIPRGAYHFFTGSKSGKLQAAHFVENVYLKKGDLPPVLDVEQANGASIKDLQQRVADWLTLVEKRYKVKPIIYSNVHFYNTYLAGRFDDYPLWVAHYLEKNKPRIQRNWTFWQHNETGHVNGIRANVDFNVFNGDSTAFNNLLIQ
ncbi:MAG: glycoside hydrolase family 25 protein [Ferruginibacter sp.]|nr:glycoside hydrolase family 25 protein [Ferruginibacter sp.]